jgi:DnaK suppressor protein
MSKKPTGKPAAKSGKPPAVPARKTEVRKAAAPPKKAVAAPPSSGKAKSQPAKDVPKAVKTGKQASAAIAKPVVKAASKPEPAAKAAQPVKPAPARTMAISKPEQTKKTPEGSKKMAPRPKVSEIVLPPGYRPSESEPFMNPMHRAYFRKRLLDWKDEILRQTRETLAILHEDSTQHADLADRATSETDRATELRTRDRQRKLIAKIDAAVARIEDGSYGYCEETGEPIGLKRLDARPIATLSVEAQERHERREKVYREE